MHRRMRRSGRRRLSPYVALLAAIALVLAACSSSTDTTTEARSDSTTGESSAPATDGGGTENSADSEGGGTSEPSGTGTFTVGLSTEPSTLDPADGLFIADHVVMLNIYDPLIWTDADGNLQPGLATSWEVDSAGMEFKFELRDDVVFHDGTPFNGEAVRAQFDRVSGITDGIGAALTILSDYSGTTVDGNTIVVSFSSPKPEFLSDLSRMWMAIPSPTALDSLGDDFDRSPVGTGPFMFEEWAGQESITLSRNDDYAWGRAFAGAGGPAGVEQLVFRILPDPSARMSAFQTGEVDAIEDPPFQEVGSLVGSGAATLVSYQAPGMPSHMMINTEKHPTDDPLVRKAMIHAVNTEELSQTAFAGLQTPASSVISPTTFGYSETAAALYGFDEELAAQLLEEAGWIDSNGDGIREKDGQPLAISYPASPAWESSYMELLSAYLTAVGFQVNLEQLDDAGVFETGAAGEHNIINMGWISSSPSVLGFVYHSSTINGGSGFTRFSDAALDAALDGAASAVDAGERAAFYREAQDIIMENALAIPLYSYDRIMLLQPGVTGWQFDSEGYPWLTGISIDR